MPKKDGPIKLPKKIAGVKIPKAVRKGAIADFLGSKAGQTLVAEAVTAAVAALVVKKQSEPGSAARKTARKAKDKIDETADRPPATGVGAGSLAFAFSEAGRAFHDALQGPGNASAPEPPDADSPADFAEPKATEPRPH